MTWSGDAILFGQPTGILRVPASGGKPQVLFATKSGEVAADPQMLPDEETVMFAVATAGSPDAWDKARIVAQSLTSGGRKTLIEGGADGRYLPTGHLVYVVGGVLFAVPFDPRRLEVTGAPASIVEGVRRPLAALGATTTPTAQLAFSSSGSLAYVPGPVSTTAGQWNLALMDRSGGVELLKLSPGAYSSPRLSPDGKRVAFETDDGREIIVWIYELAGTSSMRRLTFGGRNRFPVWSPDGERIAFQSDRDGDPAVFWQRADGTGAAERLTRPEPGTSHAPESWSPDGERLLFRATKGSNQSLWILSLKDRNATAFGAVRSDRPPNSVFSADGRWVAYQSSELGRTQIFVQPFPATGAKYQISKDLGYHPLWSPDGKELFYNPLPSQLVVVSITSRPSFTFGNPVPVPKPFTEGGTFAARNVDIMPDGKRFVGVIDAKTTTASGTSDAPQIQVVLNWFEEVKQRVPVR